MSAKKSGKSLGEVDAFDNMLTTLVELLEEKGISTHEKREKRIEREIREAES